MPSLQRHWLLRFTQKLQHPGECAGRRWRVKRRQTERRNDVCEDRDVLFGDGSRIVEVEFVHCIHRLNPTKWQSAFAKAHDKMLCEVRSNPRQKRKFRNRIISDFFWLQLNFDLRGPRLTKDTQNLGCEALRSEQLGLDLDSVLTGTQYRALGSDQSLQRSDESRLQAPYGTRNEGAHRAQRQGSLKPSVNASSLHPIRWDLCLEVAIMSIGLAQDVRQLSIHNKSLVQPFKA